jgi:hypothetical protein
MSLRSGLAAALLAALALAACGGDDDTGSVPPSTEPPDSGAPAGGVEHSTGADDLVLRVDTAGGLAAPPVPDVPQISVYGDGRLITLGPTTLEYPGPALPNFQQGLLTEAELQELLGAAEAAGLLDSTPPDYGDPPVTDLPTTAVTIDAGGVERTVGAYALDFADADVELEPAQREARQQLRDFLAGIDVDVAAEGYEADAVAVFVRPFEANETDQELAERREWPAGDLAGTGEPVGGSNARCLVIEGDDAPAVLEAAAGARAGDAWVSDGAEYLVDFRPLLPDETSCDQLVPGEVGGA